MSSDVDVDSDELDPDEPRTPAWMPLLGAGLFLLALLFFLATRSDDEGTEGDGVAPDASAQAEPAAPDEEPPSE